MQGAGSKQSYWLSKFNTDMHDMHDRTTIILL